MSLYKKAKFWAEQLFLGESRAVYFSRRGRISYASLSMAATGYDLGAETLSIEAFRPRSGKNISVQKTISWQSWVSGVRLSLQTWAG